MSSFTFGAKTTATPTFGTGSGLTFGTAPSTQPTLGFGAPAASTQPNFGFGTQAAQPAPTFGAPAAASQPPTFGTGSATPPQFGFGSNATQSSATGLFGAQAKPLFGAPAATATAGGFAFGQTPSLGAAAAPTTTATPLGFGLGAAAAAAATPSAPTFGLGAATTSAPLSFGLGTATTTSATPLGFGLGTTVTTSAPLNFGLGTTATTSAPLTFGLGTMATTSAAPISFGLGTTATTSAPLSFGLGTAATTASTTSAPLTFGLGTTAAAATTTTPSTSLSFPLGGATTTSAPLSFGLSTSTTTSIPSFGLGGLVSTTTSATTAAPTTTSATISVGLGGIAPATKTTTTTREIAPRDQPLPNEIAQCVEQFKKKLQEQKVLSSEVARCSVKEFCEVESTLETLSGVLHKVETQLLNERNSVEKLKFDMAKALQNIEMAQRTQETPPGLQYDNTAPLKYFLELAEHFEREMQSLKYRIDTTEKYIKKYNDPRSLSTHELTDGLKQLHETFVALAGRLHTLHHQVEAQKEFYLNWLKQNGGLNDGNPFESKTNRNLDALNVINNTAKLNLPSFVTGPTPFNTLSLSGNTLAFNSQQVSSNLTTPQTTQSTFPLQTFGGFGTPSLSSSSLNSSFQLERPPQSNKRGKQ